MKKILSFLNLFSSISTLVCCALPALLIVIGAGSVLASVISRFPQLIWLSTHKIELFVFSGILLLFSAIVFYKARNKTCAIDKQKACQTSKKWSFIIYIISLTLYCVGAFMAFIAPKLI